MILHICRRGNLIFRFLWPSLQSHALLSKHLVTPAGSIGFASALLVRRYRLAFMPCALLPRLCSTNRVRSVGISQRRLIMSTLPLD